MFFDLVFGLSVVLCFTTAFLLWFRIGKKNTFSIRLIALFLLFKGYSFGFYLLIKYGVLAQVPFLYKTPVPLEFLVPPLAYLYVRSVLNRETAFRKNDSWHLIPFVLCVVNYAPFYAIGLQEKREIVASVIANMDNVYLVKDGILPEWLVLIVQLMTFYIYLIFQWRLLYQYFNKYPKVIPAKVRYIKKWLYDFVKLQTFYTSSLVLLYIISSFLAFSRFEEQNVTLILSSLLVAISFLFLAGYLLWNPKVLVRLPEFSKSIPSKTSQEQDDHLDAIVNAIKTRQLFLQSNLTLTSLAQQLEIPARRVSTLVNATNHANFNDYINHLRVRHAQQLIHEGFLAKHAIEALGQASGFHSKNAFYRAFKKEFDCTPKVYLEQNKAS